MQRWQTALGDDYAKRLAWDDVEIEQATSVLGEVEWSDDLPDWLTFLSEVSASAAPPVQPLAQLPFQDIFASWAGFAREALQAQMSALDVSAQRQLDTQLFEKLFSLYLKPVDSDFNLFRRVHAGEPDIYARYVQEMRQGGLEALLRQYPVLARLLAVTLQNWVQNGLEFLQRLNADWALLQAHFGPFQSIAALQTGLSDPHHQHRTVIALTTDTGAKIVYKPKPLSLEAAYYAFLDWLNQQGLRLPFRCFAVLDRQAYGWVEFVEALPCDDEAAVQRFYQRAGMLLCVLKLLHATDCHAENLIAHGDQPVLIDMEALLSPTVRQAADNPLGGFGVENHAHNVLDTGFLPYWHWVAGLQKQYDLSALGHAEIESVQGLVWQDTNTDGMTIGMAPKPRQSHANSPFLNGRRLSPHHYLDDIDAGFSEMYRFLMAHREALPLELFANHRLRFIARPTAIYSRLYGQLLEPENLVNGIAHSLVLERLARAFLLYSHKPDLWTLLAAEQSALSQLDIPFFELTTTHTDLTVAPGQTIKNIFRRSSYDMVRQYAGEMSLVDLEHQRHIIRGSLYASVAINAEDAQTPSGDRELTATFSADAMLERALDIGHTLRETALLHDNTATWITFTSTEHRRYQFQPMQECLYDGFSGVVLFLAALEKSTGESFRPLALAATRRWRDLLDEGTDPVFRRLPIGGATGLGSIAYALGVAGQLLGEDQLLEDALRTARLITPERITEDDRYDVVGGSAGAALSLLALHRLTGEPALREHALMAGQHLLKHQLHGAWASPNKQPYTGFSHGTAGIAYALLRLYAASGEPGFLDAAEQAITYEQTQFMPAIGSWRDQPADHAPGLQSWCHGAPGIVLGRIGGLATLDTPDIRQQIETGITATQRALFDGVDHLCCGISGRLDILLETGQRLQRPDLVALSRRGAAGLAAQSGFRLFPNLPSGVLSMGFFQGLAGIGYGLLRQVQSLPCILLWETA